MFSTKLDFFLEQVKIVSYSSPEYKIKSLIHLLYLLAKIFNPLAIGILFNKIETFNEKNYKSIIADFDIVDRKDTITLNPEIRIYNQPNILTSEADIKTTIYSDKFLVMNLVKGNEYFNIRYQLKPFMIWIWISTLLLIIGGIFSLFKRTYEK